MSKRVVLAGLFHETHTFLEGCTRLTDFAIRSGMELWQARGDGSPLAGALEVAGDRGWDVWPAVDLRATPGPIVDDEVFQLFWSRLADELTRSLAAGLDAVFLVLHGAMVTTSMRDVEGELIRRIRGVPGAERLPICGVLDLHGNISRETIERSSGFVAYRSNPHVDAQQAAIDAAQLLDRILTTGEIPTALYESCAVMWPPTGTGTADEPMRTLEEMARRIEQRHPEIVAVNVMGGFSFADTEHTGVSFSAMTFGDPQIARGELKTLADYARAHRAEGNVLDPSLEVVIRQVLEAIRRGQTPVAVVEPSDNIGGGAPGDGTTLLRAFVEHRIAPSAVVINDPLAVAQLADLPIGGRCHLSLGGKTSRLTDPPYEMDVALISRSDGRFDLEDRQSHLASMSGVHIDMGPCAVVRSVGGPPQVSVLLTSRKTPPFDLGQLRSQGIAPEQLSAIGIKAAVAHRRAYGPIVGSSFTVATPGPCGSDLAQFPFQHVRRPIFPLDL